MTYSEINFPESLSHRRGKRRGAERGRVPRSNRPRGHTGGLL